MTAYFLKELWSQPFYLQGRAVRFVEGSDDTGLLETSDDQTVAGLRKAAQEHRGGIVELTAEQFEDAKKKHGQLSPKPQPLPQVVAPLDPERWGTRLKGPKESPAVAAATASVEPPKVEPPKPRVEPAQNRPKAGRAGQIKVDPPGPK